MDLEMEHPHHVTVGYTGEPGARTFYLQAEDLEHRITLLLEKEQVDGLGDLLTQLLARLGDEPATDWDRTAMDLREPLEPSWHIGEIALGVAPDRDGFVLELAEYTEDEDASEAHQIRLWLDRDQARRLAAHAHEIVGQGRPRCQLCGRPMAAEGDHVCPATNGHGSLGEP